MKVKVLNSETQVEVKEFELTSALVKEDECLIGRSQNSGLVLDSRDVSRLHGKFSRQEGQYYFSDLGSSNGSTINGKAAVVNQDYVLKAGDVVRIGEFVLVMEATDEVPEELPETVFSGIDATVISGVPSPAKVTPPESEVLEAASQTSEDVIEAELVKEVPGALVKVEMPGNHVDNHKNQTKALFDAINKRALAEVKAAGSITREAYLNAIRKAREAIEHNKLIDPDQIEKEAEKYWQSVTRGTASLGSRLGSAAAKGAANLGSRLGSAAAKGASEAGMRLGSAAKAAWRAAWKEVSAPRPESKSELNEVVNESPEGLPQTTEEIAVSEGINTLDPEVVTQVPEDTLDYSDLEDKPNQTIPKDEVSH